MTEHDPEEHAYAVRDPQALARNLARVVEEAAPDPDSVGLVLRQVPAAGREAPPGAQVTIVVGV